MTIHNIIDGRLSRYNDSIFPSTTKYVIKSNEEVKSKPELAITMPNLFRLKKLLYA